MSAMKRLLAGLAAVAGLAALLFAAPWALATWGKPSLLAGIDWRHVATVPDDGRLVLGLLSVLAWALWLVLVASVLVEVVETADRLRATRPRRPRLCVRLAALDLPRLLVRGLVVTAFTAFLGMGAARAATASVQPAVVASAPADLPPSATGEQLTVGNRELTGASHGGSEGASVVVVRGDSLWKLAAVHLGAAERWPEIFAMNRDVVADPDLILPGWRLRLPSAAPQKPGAVGTVVAAGVSQPPAAAPAPPTSSATVTGGFRVAPSTAATRGPVGAATVAAGGPASAVPVKAPVPAGPVVSISSVPAGSSSSLPPGPVSETQTADDDRPDSQDAIDEAQSLSASQALALGVLGTVGAGLAAGLVRTLRRRRDIQLALRPPGRRIRFPSESSRVVESALTLASVPSLPERLRVTPSTQRLIPEPAMATEELPPGRGPGDVVADAAGTVLRPAAASGSEPGPHEPRHAVPNTAWATVTAGLTVGGPLDVDLETYGVVTVDLDDAQAAWGTACAWALELACGTWSAEWSGGARIVAGGPVASALVAAELDSIVTMPTTNDAIDDLVATASRQRQALVGADWTLHRARLDTDARDAWWPSVYLLDRLDESSAARVAEAVRAEPRTAVSVVLVQGQSDDVSATLPGARLVGSADHAVLEPQGVRLRPVSLSALGATGVVDLLRTSHSDETDPAPWYSGNDAEQGEPPLSAAPDPAPDPAGDVPDNVPSLLPRHAVPMKEAVDVGDDSPGVTDFSHPTLMLLGPIKLLGAAGPPPARAERSCIEYCAWMVEHPGATASQMAASLLIAEGTRRSNVSRLRGWLGAGEDGVPYLPEAYTGRLYLDPLVSSDWQRLQALVSQGVNRVQTSTLVSALKLVRGAPLADAAPGQWHWAEELRIDMVSMIRDIGARLGDIALAEGDLDLARWAAARALVAAPGDEVLMRLRLRTEHRAGNRPEVERIVLHVTRHARVLGIDLDDETVEAIQEAIEGSPRARVTQERVSAS